MTSLDGQDDGVVVAALSSEAKARELADLLAEARVPSRVGYEADPASEVPHGGGGGGTWLVFVPAAERPVAEGVAREFLPWFREWFVLEGDASEAECIAALEVDDPEFDAALAAERERAGRRESQVRLLIALTVAAFALGFLRLLT